MDIQINTEALCEQIREVLLDWHPVIFFRIEPKGNAHTIEVLVPDTDAEFGLVIHPYKTVEVWRCNEDPASEALLNRTLDYMLARGYSQAYAWLPKGIRTNAPNPLERTHHKMPD